jgi:hypothetical protein
MMKYLKLDEWKEGEITEYGFKVERGILTGGSGAWPIKNISSIRAKEAPKSGFWETIGWNSARTVTIMIDGQEIEILRVENSVLDSAETHHLKFQVCSQVVHLVTEFMQKEA